MVDISTLNTSIVLTIDGVPLPLQGFDPEGDIVTVQNKQTSDAELTPDNILVGYAMRALIEVSIRILPDTPSATFLQYILNSQGNGGGLREIYMAVTNQNKVNIYGPGVLVSGMPSATLGNQKIQYLQFDFKFAEVK